jgi:hypothetical protein
VFKLKSNGQMRYDIVAAADVQRVATAATTQPLTTLVLKVDAGLPINSDE